jgi:hypothetical protein
LSVCGSSPGRSAQPSRASSGPNTWRPAAPQQRLGWRAGHSAVENRNRCRRARIARPAQGRRPSESGLRARTSSSSAVRRPPRARNVSLSRVT